MMKKKMDKKKFMTKTENQWKLIVENQAKKFDHIVVYTRSKFLTARDRICYRCSVCNRERLTGIHNYLQLKASCHKCNGTIILNGQPNWPFVVKNLAKTRNQTIIYEDCNFLNVKSGKVSYFCNICNRGDLIGLNSYLRQKSGCRFSHDKEVINRTALHLWKKAVRLNYGYLCAFTGERSSKEDKVICHHIVGFAISPELRKLPANGILMKASIHKKFHAEWGYGCNTHHQLERFYLVYKYQEVYGCGYYNDLKLHRFRMLRKKKLAAKNISEYPWTFALLKYKNLIDLATLEADDTRVKQVKLAALHKLAKERNHRIISFCSKHLGATVDLFQSFHTTRGTFYCDKHQKGATLLTANYRSSSCGLPCCSKEHRFTAQKIAEKNEGLLKSLTLECKNNGHTLKSIAAVNGIYINVSTQVIIGLGCPLHPNALHETSIKNYRTKIKRTAIKNAGAIRTSSFSKNFCCCYQKIKKTS